MSQYSELKQVLQAQLNWHGARISFLALFLLALLKVGLSQHLMSGQPLKVPLLSSGQNA